MSLVPSITEALAATRPEALVGATDWCTHPADLNVTRVRGTKNPDRSTIVELKPDLVIANMEENRELDVRQLREAGVQVWVTRIEVVSDAFSSLRRMFDEALRWPVPTWLDSAEQEWAEPAATSRGRVAVPIWRDPWMVVGPRTFTTDLLRLLGLSNAFDVGDDRYPHVELSEIDAQDIDVVLLPDEPYAFSEDDGPADFTQVPSALVSGRLLTWYGPSMVNARADLQAVVDRALVSGPT